jgi:hypothetical protein
MLKNMLLFADRHEVDKIYLYVMPGKYKDEETDPVFDDERIELLYLGKDGMKLNSNLKLHDTKILASQIIQTTGFQSKLHRDYSYILPGTKIAFLSLPNTSTHPRFLATTGALTHGNYKDGSKGPANAQGMKAAIMHQYGFIFVKVKNSRLFFAHQVSALKNGNFNYAQELYKDGSVYTEPVEAIILGDWHCGMTCSKTRKRTFIMLDSMMPKRVVFHDLMDARSVNHHEQDDSLSRAYLYQDNKQSLEQEVRECLAELNYFAERYPHIQFFVSESNHDLFIRRYIGEGMFLKDGQNFFFACELASQMKHKSHQPILQTAMELVGEIADNVTFWNEDDEYRVSGVLLSAHGHRGVNGSRGGGKSFSNNNLKQITGHEHSPSIHPNGMVVGTSTILRQPYMKGPSSHMNSHGILYKSGRYTLLTIIH